MVLYFDPLTVGKVVSTIPVWRDAAGTLLQSSVTVVWFIYHRPPSSIG